MWLTRRRGYRVVPTSLHAFVQANSTSEKGVSAALHSSTALVVAETNSDSIYENLAAEEALIRGLALDKDQCLLLYYVNRPCVVVGRNQNLFQEVSLRRAARDGVDVARRASGGGAVFHDTHNLCFSFFTHRTRYAPEKTIQLVRLGLIAAYGIDPARLTSTGRHDLFLDHKKITGSAMRVQRDIAYHHCTLLVDTPRTLLGRYLHPEGDYVDFQTSSIGSVRSPVTTLTESQCIPAAGGNAMAEMKANMTEFFFSQGSRVLADAAPWDMDVAALRHDFASTRVACATRPLHHLNVRQAVEEDMPFTEGEGRRYVRGDAVTLGEAVRKAKSPAWAYAMPVFTSTVQITQTEFRRCLGSFSSWTDVVLLSSLTSEELQDELTQMLFMESASGRLADAVRLHTTVDHRNVTRLTVTTFDSRHARADGSFASEGTSETPVGWLSRYLTTVLVGSPCDAPVAGAETAGDASVLVHGFLHEAGAAAPDLPDLARNAAVLLTIKTLLSVWRGKNVFDVSNGA
ncbi:lipoate-protein ligase-like lipoyl ligase [Lotmaria passim]